MFGYRSRWPQAKLTLSQGCFTRLPAAAGAVERKGRSRPGVPVASESGNSDGRSAAASPSWRSAARRPADSDRRPRRPDQMARAGGRFASIVQCAPGPGRAIRYRAGGASGGTSRADREALDHRISSASCGGRETT